MMKAVLLALLVALLVPAFAQQPAPKPYRNGPVWEIAYIRAKAGMEDRYSRYLAEEWKREQEAMKKAGYITDYKVLVTEPHGPQDFDFILMTQFKDFASMEANQDKMEALAQQTFGGQQKIEAGYQDRSSFREVMGNRLAREIVLEPAK
jgi:hypothetical protein